MEDTGSDDLITWLRQDFATVQSWADYPAAWPWREALQSVLQRMTDVISVYMHGSSRTPEWFPRLKEFILTMIQFYVDDKDMRYLQRPTLVDTLQWRIMGTENIRKAESFVRLSLTQCTTTLDLIIGKADDFVDNEIREIQADVSRNLSRLDGLNWNKCDLTKCRDLLNILTLKKLIDITEIYIQADEIFSTLCHTICTRIYKIADHLDMELQESIFDKFGDRDFAKPDDLPIEDAPSVEDAAAV